MQVVAEAEPRSKMLYKVSEVTREFGVTVRALRFYEERGLLKPVRVGTHRRYTTEDKTRVASILKGKQGTRFNGHRNCRDAHS